MTVQDNALILSFIHAGLAIKNLEVAVHEARVSKDEDYRKMADTLKVTKERFVKAKAMMDKKLLKEGITSEAFEEEIERVQHDTWDELK